MRKPFSADGCVRVMEVTVHEMCEHFAAEGDEWDLQFTVREDPWWSPHSRGSGG